MLLKNALPVLEHNIITYGWLKKRKYLHLSHLNVYLQRIWTLNRKQNEVLFSLLTWLYYLAIFETQAKIVYGR